MINSNKNLYYLEELPDYKVASSFSDIRGWEVVDSEGQTVGKVSDLLVNKETERVVYVDVEVDQSLMEDVYGSYKELVDEGAHEFLNKEGENHLIIPIGMVSLDSGSKKVVADTISHSTFAKTRRYKKGQAIDHGYELSVFRHYIGDDEMEDTSTHGEELYEHKEFQFPRDKP